MVAFGDKILMKKNDIETISTISFKLKDKPGRDWKAFNLVSQFGFVPENVIVSKVRSKNNTFVFSAVKTNKPKVKK